MFKHNCPHTLSGVCIDCYNNTFSDLQTVKCERDELVIALEKSSAQLTRLGYSANHADKALAKVGKKL